ncbi:MAG: hypothetical protein LKM30_07925 [Bacilli bacterium]|jgi:ribosome maturation factor RimP|nr:hypothetical protein [Bacilli bacterium]
MTETTLADIRSILQKTADEMGLTLVSVKFLPSAENGPTLEVLIDKDYAIDLPTIEAYTDKVNPLLDKLDTGDESYLLDIGSGGSEREIPFADLPKLADHYLDLVLATGEKLTAKAVSADSTTLMVLYFLKGQKKKRTFHPADIRSIRMGYKA